MHSCSDICIDWIDLFVGGGMDVSCTTCVAAVAVVGSFIDVFAVTVSLKKVSGDDRSKSKVISWLFSTLDGVYSLCDCCRSNQKKELLHIFC